MIVQLELSAEEIKNLMTSISQAPAYMVYNALQQLEPQLRNAEVLENPAPQYQAPIQQPPAPIQPPYQPPYQPPVPPVPAPVAIDPNKGLLKGFCRACPAIIKPHNYDPENDVYICANCGNKNKEPIDMETIEKEAEHTTNWSKVPEQLKPKHLQT